MIHVTILGTASNAPTKDRNHPAVHLQYLNNRFLFDCGEGTQRQMMIAGLSPYKLNAIFITHWHADHWLGLGGIIQTMSFWGREEELQVHGPKGVKKFVKFYTKNDWFEAAFPVKAVEVKEGKVFENQDCTVNAFSTSHPAECVGYCFEDKVGYNLDKAKLDRLGLLNNPKCKQLKDKGAITWKGKVIRLKDVARQLSKPRKVAYVTDTQPVKTIVGAVKDAELLICEGTFAEDLREQAHEYGHMTAKDAARIAKEARVKRLVLTHFSPRYEDLKPLEAEARSIFRNTEAAKDFMTIEL